MVTVYCKKHKTYKALRRPTAKCVPCEMIYELINLVPGIEADRKEKK